MSEAAHAQLRHATEDDLEAINGVVRAAVMGWKLPPRVIRLSISSYLYKPLDLRHMTIMLAQIRTGPDTWKLVGVAAWEDAATGDLPVGKSGLLLHGIYVDPLHQRQGIGKALLSSAVHAVRERHMDGLLVKAQPDAVDFFIAQGLEKLPATDDVRQYANRFWKPCR